MNRRLTQTHTGFLTTRHRPHWENSNLDVCALTNALESGANCSSLRFYNHVNRNSRTCAWCEGSVCSLCPRYIYAYYIHVLYIQTAHRFVATVKGNQQRKRRHYAIDKTRSSAQLLLTSFPSFTKAETRGFRNIGKYLAHCPLRSKYNNNIVRFPI